MKADYHLTKKKEKEKIKNKRINSEKTVGSGTWKKEEGVCGQVKILTIKSTALGPVSRKSRNVSGAFRET